MHIRKEGVEKFWTVQRKTEDGWEIVHDHWLAKIPQHLRFGPNREFLEPVRSFEANGPIWQRTGNNGFETEAQALELLYLIAAFVPEQVFRAAHIELNCFVTQSISIERKNYSK